MIRRWNKVFATSVLTVCVTSLGALASAGPSGIERSDRVLGWDAELGRGTVSSYVRLQPDGTPDTIGVVFSAGALEALPEGSDHHHCFDRDADGTIDAQRECLQNHEYVLPLPDIAARQADVPFKWVLLNWNPGGHIPPGVYDVPHFDVHFFMERIENVFALQAGPCGAELMRCDQFEIARRPVPDGYMHADFKDVEGIVPAMGNHLIDLTGPEFHGEPFTRSWIFGVYDGRVTFYEEMVALAYLQGRPDVCSPIKSPPAVDRTGFYPTASCLRHDAETGETTVSMEQFVRREAQALTALR
jgi:hypothetical protein